MLLYIRTFVKDWKSCAILNLMFKDQFAAGELLAERLQEYKNQNAMILAIPRGGVVTGAGLAKKLGLPLDIIVTHKIGAPENPELAIGAVGETEGSFWLNEGLMRELGVDEGYVGKEIEIQQREIKRREKIYRQGKSPLDLKNKTVILVDDGIATGATMMAALREVRNVEPKKIVVAIPVSAADTLGKLKKEADEVICLEKPELFFAVGQWYDNFKQFTDEEIVKLLHP